MRCPKCGYISFDRQRSCGKCSNDLTAVSELLQGTAGKATAPFFLGAILGKQDPYAAETTPALHEEEEPLDLDELETVTLSADEEELDFAGAPLDADDLEDQPLPSLGFADIDVSDLMPLQEEEEEQVLSLGDEHEEELLPPAPPEEEEELLAPIPSEEKKEELRGIEFSGFDSDDMLTVDEQEISFDDSLEDETTKPEDNAEDEEIIDLSSLMDFEETPAQPTNKEEDHDIFELSLEDEENASPPADEPKKPKNAVSDIADLGLTLEDDAH